MPAIGRVWWAAAALSATLGAMPAGAVGFGPLVLQGTIDGPREGFRLDLLNSEAEAGEFLVYAIGAESEESQARVSVLPASTVLGGNRARKVLVIADDLQVGETYHFRVCAERKPASEGIMIHARVCSKISARRVS